jgi:hypothetical protein
MVWKMGSLFSISTIGRSGKTLLHAGGRRLPFHRAVEIVAHEEAAAQQEFAHGGGLRIGEVPVAHFHAVEPRDD